MNHAVAGRSVAITTNPAHFLEGVAYRNEASEGWQIAYLLAVARYYEFAGDRSSSKLGVHGERGGCSAVRVDHQFSTTGGDARSGCIGLLVSRDGCQVCSSAAAVDGDGRCAGASVASYDGQDTFVGRDSGGRDVSDAGTAGASEAQDVGRDGFESAGIVVGEQGNAVRGSVDSVNVQASPIKSKTELNRLARQKAKARKQRKQLRESSDGLDEEQRALKTSLARKWMAENDLAVLKAKRELAAIESCDVIEECKRYRTGVVRRAETNMVAIEKQHKQLAASGNLPGAVAVESGVDNDVHTVLTGSSISPNSSSSMIEFREVQKRCLDLEEKNAKLIKALERCGLTEAIACNWDKETFTDDTTGQALFDELHGDSGVAVYNVVRDGVHKFKIGLSEFD